MLDLLQEAGDIEGVEGELEETELPLSDDVQLSTSEGGTPPSPTSGSGSGLGLGARGVDSESWALGTSFFQTFMIASDEGGLEERGRGRA